MKFNPNLLERKYVYVCAVLLVSYCSMSSAGTIIGPLPYRSVTNSPFLLLQPGSFVEDFEDNTYSPGWTVSEGWRRCFHPGCFADSVDGDDGTVDGNGSNGTSFCFGPACGTNNLSIGFEFDSSVLGGYPTKVGIVWTDGGFFLAGNFQDKNFQTQFDWFDPTGALINSFVIANGDGDYRGQTEEDSFIGMEYEGGISRLRVSGIGDVNYIELDHLQYNEGLGIVYLLLHGTASNPKTWNELVEYKFGGHCPKIKQKTLVVTEESACYRYKFAPKMLDDDTWRNGDGSTFQELGDEVRSAVNKINERLHPKAIILVGHSRGGLAARAYLQEIPESTPYKLALLTIGTPHQGTPLGRIPRWLYAKGYEPKNVTTSSVVKNICKLGSDPVAKCIDKIRRLLFSPSAGYQATAHDVDGNPKRKPISEEIWSLNDGVDRLDDWVSTFGQIYSIGLRLGEKFNGEQNLLHDGAILGKALIPGNFKTMRRSVLKNTGRFEGKKWLCSEVEKIDPSNWACHGDGIVPAVSQRLTRLPGFSQEGKPLHATVLMGISHSGETGRILEISQMLDDIASEF